MSVNLCLSSHVYFSLFFFQAEDGIRAGTVTGVQTCALPIYPAPTVFTKGSRYDRLIEAFGGTGYHAVDTASLSTALQRALDARTPALINCVIDPTAGTESGHLGSLN